MYKRHNLLNNLLLGDLYMYTDCVSNVEHWGFITKQVKRPRLCYIENHLNSTVLCLTVLVGATHHTSNFKETCVGGQIHTKCMYRKDNNTSDVRVGSEKNVMKTICYIITWLFVRFVYVPLVCVCVCVVFKFIIFILYFEWSWNEYTQWLYE